MKTKLKVLLTSILLMFFISGCANAGKDQSVKSGEIVTLDASESTALLRGPIISYKWKQLKGLSVELDDDSSIKTTFVAPIVEEETELVFRLSTFEKGFHTRDTITVKVLPSEVAQNIAPVAMINASALTVKQNASITFDASASSDSDGTIQSYEWKNGDEVLSTEETFTYEFSEAGTATISLMVTDNENASSTESVNITINELQAPVAKINASKVNVTLNEEITLDANESTDADGTIVSYQWLDESNQTLGTNNTLVYDYSRTGEYKIQLIVTDDDGLTNSEIINISVTPSMTELKVSIAGSSNTTATINVAETLQLQATAYFNDNSTQDYTNQITWNYATEFAIIDANGLLTAIKEGYTSVSGANTNSLDINIVDVDGTISISGIIKDVNNAPISGATVLIGTSTKVTGTDGSYSFTGLENVQRTNVNVTHPEYMANSKVVIGSPDHLTFTQDIVLTKAKATITFNSTQGTTLEQSTYAKVELPANGYIDSEGNDYVGEIIAKMSYFPITTVAGQAAFPGTFEGMNGNETFPIESFGFMNVELTDLNGQALNLAPGSTATLTFPRDYDVYTSLTTIPLWYYDTQLGYWVEDGQAQRVGYSSYVGTVTHFTAWNLDAKGPRSGTVFVCVEDENQIKIPNASVQFSSTNWLSYILKTDELGFLEVYNALAGKALTLTASKIKDGKLYYGEHSSKITLPEGSTTNVEPCIVLKEQGVIGNSIQLKGRAVDFDGNPQGSGYLTLNYNQSIATNNDGYFDVIIDTPTNLSNFIGDGECNTYFTLQANKKVYELGDISVCLFGGGIPPILD